MPFFCDRCCVWISFLSFLQLKLRKIVSENFSKQKSSSFSYSNLDLGKLLVNGRKTKNGTRSFSDSNCNIKNGFVHSASDPLSLRHVGRSVRYESIEDCGTLFCLAVSFFFPWFSFQHLNSFHVNISLNATCKILAGHIHCWGSSIK